MPRISSTLTVNNNSEIKIVSKQSFETSTSSKKQDLTFLTQSMQTLKDVDVNLLTDLGKKQQQTINPLANSNSTNKKQQRTSDEEEDTIGDDEQDLEELNDEEESKTKKIKN